jgi:hypothetical protein
VKINIKLDNVIIDDNKLRLLETNSIINAIFNNYDNINDGIIKCTSLICGGNKGHYKRGASITEDVKNELIDYYTYRY